MRKAIRDEEADQINQLKKFGMEVTTPDKTEFKKLMGPAYDRMKAICGEENIAAFIKLVDEAR
jgi:TRAP-type C4-dicarboxylate transport system substrate-binding protein